MQGLEETLRTRMVRVLFGLTIGLAAALLFWQQLMLGRVLLPIFGSVPTVWLVSLVVFQTVLLAAYGAAHLSASWPRIFAAGLIVLLTLGAIAQHLLAPTAEILANIREINAVSVIAALLGLSGVSLFLLSMISPLMQRIYATLAQPDAADPYFLYAASNFGSFAGLLLFPLLLEPLFGVKLSQHIWYVSAAVFAVLLVTCLIFCSQRTKKIAPRDGEAVANPVMQSMTPVGINENEGVKPKPLLWLFYSFLPCALSFGATTHLISDIAPLPLLSMVPLALYLLTFVLAFSRKDRFGDDVAVVQVFLIAFYLFREIFTGFKPGQLFDVLLVLATFFTTAWRCHRELARLRPSSKHLTYYYMMLALGGALGGLINVFVIPFILPLPLEFAIFLILSLLPHYRDDLARLKKPDLKTMHALIFILLAVTLVLLAVQYMNDAVARSITPVALILSLMLATMLPSVLAAGATLMIIVMLLVVPETIALQRDFFGVKRVVDRTLEDHIVYRTLLHGTTSHGMQQRSPKISTQPLLYYTAGGGLYDVMTTLRPQRFGVVGLGMGAVSCMPPKGAEVRFYEIDSGVETLARKYFTFLDECPADVVIGDARMTLAKDDRQYDVLLLDAFSSDSIPVHLLTEEMFAGYKQHIAPHGVLITHISNRYLNLRHVIAGAAKALGWRGALKTFTPPEDAYNKTASEFAILSPDAEVVDRFLKMEGWKPIEDVEPLRWTDDHISIIPILNFGFGKW